MNTFGNPVQFSFLMLWRYFHDDVQLRLELHPGDEFERGGLGAETAREIL
jgi:hypothetical protein